VHDAQPGAEGTISGQLKRVITHWLLSPPMSQSIIFLIFQQKNQKNKDALAAVTLLEKKHHETDIRKNTKTTANQLSSSFESCMCTRRATQHTVVGAGA
jgi:hypothetical protein